MAPLTAILLAAGVGCGEAPAPARPVLPLEGVAAAAPVQDGVIRGVTISCPTWGWEWGSDAMAETLDELGGYGVNWVAIHPYARIHGDGRVDGWGLEADAPPEWLTRPIREAHARGQRILIKPHLAYWGSPFSWRGEIRFDDPTARARFFRDYAAWINALATITRDADAFVVGTELDNTLEAEVQWRAVIAGVRQRFPGPLTYAANWDGYAKVPFWDALDAVGVQAYFPLTRGATDDAALAAGWVRVMKEVRAVSERTGKPVVFTELGYPRSELAAEEPWRAEDDRDASELQERCLRAALAAIDAEPAVVGAFLWKEMPGGAVAEDFALEREGVRAVMREKWGGGDR